MLVCKKATQNPESSSQEKKTKKVSWVWVQKKKKGEDIMALCNIQLRIQ